jgi:hypothetical protein
MKLGGKPTFTSNSIPTVKKKHGPYVKEISSLDILISKQPVIQEKKRAVIIISTHGELFVKHDTFHLKEGESVMDHYLDNDQLAESIETFRVPKDMNIIKYTEIPPGVVNIISETVVDDYTEMLYGRDLSFAAKTDFLGKLYDPDRIDFLSPEMDKFMSGIVEKMKKKKESDTKEVAGIAPNSDDIQYKRNNWYYDRGYNVDRFGPGDVMTNKMFTVTPDDIYGESNTFLTSAINWKIGLIVPPDSHINLYDKIASEKGLLYNSKFEYVNMELLLNYLRDLKYTEVIIFDLTCAELDTSDGEGEPRFPRDTRVSGFITAARKRKISGGKKRTLRKKRKDRRKSKRRPVILVSAT